MQKFKPAEAIGKHLREIEKQIEGAFPDNEVVKRIMVKRRNALRSSSNPADENLAVNNLP